MEPFDTQTMEFFSDYAQLITCIVSAIREDKLNAEDKAAILEAIKPFQRLADVLTTVAPGA